MPASGFLLRGGFPCRSSRADPGGVRGAAGGGAWAGCRFGIGRARSADRPGGRDGPNLDGPNLDGPSVDGPSLDRICGLDRGPAG